LIASNTFNFRGRIAIHDEIRPRERPDIRPPQPPCHLPLAPHPFGRVGPPAYRLTRKPDRLIVGQRANQHGATLIMDAIRTGHPQPPPARLFHRESALHAARSTVRRGSPRTAALHSADAHASRVVYSPPCLLLPGSIPPIVNKLRNADSGGLFPFLPPSQQFDLRL
jgi:hypothetical protein